MDIKKDGVKIEVSKKEFEKLLSSYTPCEEIEVTYYIGHYYNSVDFDYYIDKFKRVISVTCELKTAKQVSQIVDMANNFGFKLVNLSEV